MTPAAMAHILARELRLTRLVVVLVPSRRGLGMLRHAQERNPDWYRALCAAHLKTSRRRHRSRHPDTVITRRETLAALERIAEGRTDSLYAERLAPIIAAEMRAEKAA